LVRQAIFLDHGILDLKIINALENLRPIPDPENISKADNYDEQEFKKKYCIDHIAFQQK
jgi:hypothetical protein